MEHPEQAAAFAEDLLQATAADAHPVLNAIIRRGIDGHAQYENGDREDSGAILPKP